MAEVKVLRREEKPRDRRGGEEKEAMGEDVEGREKEEERKRLEGEK